MINNPIATAEMIFPAVSLKYIGSYSCQQNGSSGFRKQYSSNELVALTVVLTLKSNSMFTAF